MTYSVGDLISIGTKYMIIDSYVLERTLKGIQSSRDSIHVDGQPVRKERVNGTNSEITQLKGKTNKLIRTVDETRLEMSDIEKGLRNEISITANGLSAEIQRSTEAEGALSTRITANADGLSAEVKRAQGQEVELAAALKVASDASKLFLTSA